MQDVNIVGTHSGAPYQRGIFCKENRVIR